MRVRTLIVGGVLLLAGACDGPGVVRPDGPFVGTGQVPALTTAIVGSWQRILFFLDDFGFARSSETRWQFDADGTAVRSIIARNFTAGIADVSISTARWTIVNSALQIDFLTPSPGTIQLDVRIQSDTLYLAGQAYARGSS